MRSGKKCPGGVDVLIFSTRKGIVKMMTKIWVVALLSVFFVLISVQIITFSKKRSEAAAEFQKTEAALRRAEEDRARLQRELDYYKNPENLEKELRARFNYKSPGEQTIILVPSENNASSSQ